MRPLALIMSLLVGAAAASGAGPGPIRSEFEIDPTDFDFQPLVFPEAGGAYVVLWNFGFFGTHLRRYDATGAPVGPASALSTPAVLGDVARDAAGNFVVDRSRTRSTSPHRGRWR